MIRDMVLRAWFFLYFYKTGAAHTCELWDGMQGIPYTPFLSVERSSHLKILSVERPSHLKILKPVSWGFSNYGAGSCRCSALNPFLPPLKHATPSLFTFCLIISESATCHHREDPRPPWLAFYTPHPHLPPALLLHCFVDLLPIFNRHLQAYGSAER